MPVQFAQPISQFVNPNSVEISQVLREKYLTSFAAQDELQQKLLELQTAPFAGDIAARNALIADTNKKLGEFAERGDYENLTVPIANVARETSKKFTPLAQNYAAYEKAKQVEQERMLRGDITREQYDRWLERSKYNYDPTSGDYSAYNGVQFDDAGNAIQSSFYNHTPIAAAVDVDKEILDVLNTLEREKTGGSVSSGYDEQGGLIFYVQREGQIVERVSPERVDAAVKEVLNRSNVRSYLDQESEFQVFDLNDQELDLILSNKAQSPNKAIRALALDARGQSTGSKKTTLRNIIEAENTSKYINYGRSIVGPGSRYGGGTTRKFDADFTEALYGSSSATAPPAPPVNPSTNGQPLSVPSVFFDPNEKAITQEKLDQTLKANRQLATTSVGLIRNNYGKVFNHLMDIAGVTDAQRARLEGKNPEAYSNVMLQVGRHLQGMTLQQLTEAANKSANPSEAFEYLQAQRAQFNKHQAIIKAGEDFNATVRNDVGLTPDKLIDGALEMYASEYRTPGGTKAPIAVSEIASNLDAQTFVNTVYRMRKALGVDESLIQREITSSLSRHYGLNANQASALINERNVNAIDNTLATYYDNVREERLEDFNEKLGTYSNATLTMKEFVNAPGDRSKNYSDSDAMRKAAEGKTTSGLNISGLTDLQGVTIPNSKVTKLTFTTVLQDGTAIPALALTLEDSNTPAIVRYEELFTNEDFKNYILSPKTADILGEAYTYTYNNPASSAKGQPAVITRNFSDGTLIAKLYPVVGGNNSFAGYGKVETDFNGNKASMSFDQFLYFYNTME